MGVGTLLLLLFSGRAAAAALSFSSSVVDDIRPVRALQWSEENGLLSVSLSLPTAKVRLSNLQPHRVLGGAAATAAVRSFVHRGGGPGDVRWASFTVTDEAGLSHGSVRVGDDVFVVQPAHHHRPHMPPADYAALAALAPLAVHRADGGARAARGCGVGQHGHGVGGGGGSGAQRRSLMGLTPFNQCWSGQAWWQARGSRPINVGVRADASYVVRYGPSAQAVAAAVAALHAAFNVGVMEPQLGVRLVVEELLVDFSTTPFLSELQPCATDIGTKLDNLRAWRVLKGGVTRGIWHLFSDCYSGGGGATGIAYTATLCDPLYGVAITSDFTDFTVMAHEYGHVLGATHTFQQGQGTTGSLMDYADGVYNGSVQFHPVYSRNELCNHLESRTCPGPPAGVPLCFFETNGTTPNVTFCPSSSSAPGGATGSSSSSSGGGSSSSSSTAPSAGAASSSSGVPSVVLVGGGVAVGVLVVVAATVAVVRSGIFDDPASGDKDNEQPSDEQTQGDTTPMRRSVADSQNCGAIELL